MKRVSIIIAVLLFTATAVIAQSKKEKQKEDFEKIKSIVESNSYKFVARKVTPRGMGYIDLTTTPNYLKIYENNAEADLPFYGEAYNIGYNDDGGIKFVGKMEDKEITINEKKQSINIKFKVSKGGDYFNCYLNISRSGSATLTVNSYNRSTISYYGNVTDMEVEA